MALVTALLVLSLIDLDHQILPNVITLPGIALGIAASLVAWRWAGRAIRVRSSRSPPRPADTSPSGAVALAYRRTRGVEGLGQGDWKMAAMLGAFLGWQRMLLTILLASVAGDDRRPRPHGRRADDRRSTRCRWGRSWVWPASLVLFVGEPPLAWYRGLWPA